MSNENVVGDTIKWYDDQKVQYIYYIQNGEFSDMDIISAIYINKKMTQLAFMLKNGDMYATSEELYNIYKEHFYHKAETETIVADGNITEL